MKKSNAKKKTKSSTTKAVKSKKRNATNSTSGLQRRGISKTTNKRTKRRVQETKVVRKTTKVFKGLRKSRKQSLKISGSRKKQTINIRTRKTSVLKTKAVRGQNRFVIITDQKGFKNKIDAVRTGNMPILKKYIEKNKPIKGKGFKQPKAVQIVLITKKGRKTFEKANKLSDPDFIVNEKNVRELVLSKMVEYQDTYIDMKEEVENGEAEEFAAMAFESKSDWVWNPKNIQQISIRFIY